MNPRDCATIGGSDPTIGSKSNGAPPVSETGFEGTVTDGSVSNRMLGRELLVYGLGTLVSRAASFIMLPVYTHLLTPADYGLLQMLDTTLDLASILVSAGVTLGVMRFYFKAQTRRARNEVLGSAFVLQVGLNAVGTLLLCLGAQPICRLLLGGAGSATVVYVAAMNFTLGVLTTVPLLKMQMDHKALLYSLCAFSRVMLQMSLNILFLVGFRWGVLGILLSGLVTNLVIGTTSVAWMLRVSKFEVSRAAIRDLRRFGLPYQVTTAATFILTFGDRFFLKAWGGLAAVGVYALAYQFGFLMCSFGVVPFMRAWVPQRYLLVSEPRELRDAKYNEGLRHLNYVMITTALGMIVFVRPALQVLSTPSYWSAADIVPVVIAAYVFQAWTDVVQFGIDVSERTKYMTYSTWISVAVILGLYAVLIPAIGGMGAAVATLLAFVVRFALVWWFSHKLWPVSYRWGHPLKLATIASAVAGVAVAVNIRSVLGEVFLGSGLVAVYLTLVWLVVFDSADRRLTSQMIRFLPRAAIARLARP